MTPSNWRKACRNDAISRHFVPIVSDIVSSHFEKLHLATPSCFSKCRQDWLSMKRSWIQKPDSVCKSFPVPALCACPRTGGQAMMIRQLSVQPYTAQNTQSKLRALITRKRGICTEGTKACDWRFPSEEEIMSNLSSIRVWTREEPGGKFEICLKRTLFIPESKEGPTIADCPLRRCHVGFPDLTVATTRSGDELLIFFQTGPGRR
jgi:hypothetical protein